MTAEDPKDVQPPQPVAPETAPDAATARNKLVGRLIIVAFGLLLLIYFVPLAWTFIRPH